MINHIWLDGLQLNWKLENGIQHEFFYILHVFINFCYGFVSMATKVFFIQK